MSNHNHEHSHHDEDCHCHDCEEKKNNTERTSIEEAGGVAVGLTGHIHGYNADVAARFSNALLTTGKWVEKESGSLLGHIKAAIYTSEGKGITLNLTHIENGVEQHGVLPPQEKVNFNFMSAVIEVDAHALEHVMIDALEDSGIDYHLDKHHHHDHDHDHHDHEEHHDGECDCDHDHHDHGHHHHDHEEGHDDGVCHCKACDDRRKEESERAEKGSFWNKIRRSRK
ncbi:MAG: hydrogenase nickel incorporation protein HypA [Candidatus Methanoplasma sp.]|nr:hydrogenase nickel incorporation protein HypA [Candidatus Methanoplasma sp.]